MIIYTLIFFLIDIFSKIIINKCMVQFSSVNIIDNFFYITYVHNTGAAFSIMNDKSWLVLILSIMVIIFIIYYVTKNSLNNRIEKIGYSMIIGGSIGNLFDRILYGYVRDFLDFRIFGYDYPIFNVADTFIVIGVFIIVIYMLGGNNNGNRSSRRK